MVFVNIIIVQNNISGLPGVSRDDISINEEIILTNEDNTGINSFKWELLSWPGSPYSDGPILNGSSSSQASFIPTDIGTYLIQLTANNGYYGRTAITIKTEKLGLLLPSASEGVEFLEGWSGKLNYNINQIELHAIHIDVANEINQLEEKLVPVSNDILIIEDKEDNYKKKKMKIGSFSGRGRYISETLISSGEIYFELSKTPKNSNYSSFKKTLQVFRNGYLMWYDSDLPNENSWKYDAELNQIFFTSNVGSKYSFCYWINE